MSVGEYLIFCDNCDIALEKKKGKYVCPNCGKEAKVDGEDLF